MTNGSTIVEFLDELIDKIRREVGGGGGGDDALRGLEDCLVNCRDALRGELLINREEKSCQLLELLEDADRLLKTAADNQGSSFLSSQFILKTAKIQQEIHSFTADFRAIDGSKSDAKKKNESMYAVSSVSCLIDTLAPKVSISLANGMRSELRGDIMKLSSTLSHVQALIHKVEKLPEIRESRVVEWMSLLRDAIYDAEDLLDELEYERLRREVELKGVRAGGSLSSVFNRALRMFDLGDGDSAAAAVATRIMETEGRVYKISSDLRGLLALLPSSDFKEKQKQLGIQEVLQKSLPSKSIFGREEERSKLIQLLLGAGSGTEPANCEGISVLAVVGMGGLGKTTLAKLVYDDMKVADHFQLRLWVSVSQYFDVKKLSKQILASIPGNDGLSITNLSRLQIILKEKLISKRFLIVLDDIWNEDEIKWETFMAPFMFGLPGSKILATTRSQKVANAMGVMNPIYLPGISDEDYWCLFKMYAFGSQNSENYPTLEKIGKKIAHKLKGSPLAAMTLGRLLNSNLNMEHWRTIMEKGIWELKQGENDILPVLESSYRHLPSHLKQCFQYCSLFPKDHVFDKDSLVQIWVAEGLLIPQGNIRIEDVGCRYFDDLLHRSFFQEHQGGYCMHDLLHDLAQYISRDEYFRIEDAKSQLLIPNTVHHLSVQDPNIELSDFIYLSKNKKLRTLCFFGKLAPDFGRALDSLKIESIGIRVLDLQGSHMKELPDSISNLVHLRYLDLSHTLVHSLPESVCTLYNLQVLKLEGSRIEHFPKAITRMTNLRHLYADKSSISQISGIGSLTALQKLDHFKILNKQGHMIDELKYMNELRGRLCISSLENICSFGDASQAKLNNKRNLCELSLEWASKRQYIKGIEEHHVNILEGLQPDSYLRVLQINSYCGTIAPSWLGSLVLRNLDTVHLTACKMLKQLPAFGQFPFLKVLKFRSLHQLEEVGPDFYGPVEGKSFTLLEQLEFKDMPEWIVWSSAESGCLFPALCLLHIEDCPKLIRIPCFNSASNLPSIKKISIINCGGLVSLEKLFLLPSLESLTILKCPLLTAITLPNVGEARQCSSSLRFLCTDTPSLILLPGAGLASLQELEIHESLLISLSAAGEGQLWLQELASLEKLSFKNCVTLHSLPSNLLMVSTLKSLTIENCPELRSLPDNGLPESLSSLHLENCPQLKESCRKEIGLDWYKIAHVTSLYFDGEHIA